MCCKSCELSCAEHGITRMAHLSWQSLNACPSTRLVLTLDADCFGAPVDFVHESEGHDLGVYLQLEAVIDKNVKRWDPDMTGPSLSSRLMDICAPLLSLFHMLFLFALILCHWLCRMQRDPADLLSWVVVISHFRSSPGLQSSLCH